MEVVVISRKNYDGSFTEKFSGTRWDRNRAKRGLARSGSRVE